MRAHPLVGDSAIAAFVLLSHLGQATGETHRPDPGWWSVVTSVVVGLLLAGPLAVRRRWPVWSAYVALAGLALSLVHPDVDSSLALLAPCFMIYTLVADVGRRAALLYSALVGLLFASRVFGSGRPFEELPVVLGFLLAFYVVVAGFCWVLGEFVGARRAYHSAVEQRLRSLEFERDQQARIAVAEERNRIAREIHDVLAHSISVMVTQADGARYALHRKPELAERALGAIGSTGRDALNELRGLLSVLRNPGEDDVRAPQPTATGLVDLVDRVRSLGLDVALEVTGDFAALPTGIGLSVYRIVQESLTNSLKHGGPGTAASVRAVHDGRRVVLDVVDDGGTARTPELASGGNGLIGMRERAAIYGGDLRAGPREGGGWCVHAELPLDRAVDTAADHGESGVARERTRAR
ncbi:sensor histidine kinase [Saccharopolyspora rosea]